MFPVASLISHKEDVGIEPTKVSPEELLGVPPRTKGIIGLCPEGKVLKTLPNHPHTTLRKIPVVEVGITAKAQGRT